MFPNPLAPDIQIHVRWGTRLGIWASISLAVTLHSSTRTRMIFSQSDASWGVADEWGIDGCWWMDGCDGWTWWTGQKTWWQAIWTDPPVELISSTLCAKNQRSMVDVDDRDEEKYDVGLIPYSVKPRQGHSLWRNGSNVIHIPSIHILNRHKNQNYWPHLFSKYSKKHSSLGSTELLTKIRSLLLAVLRALILQCYLPLRW